MTEITGSYTQHLPMVRMKLKTRRTYPFGCFSGSRMLEQIEQNRAYVQLGRRDGPGIDMSMVAAIVTMIEEHKGDGVYVHLKILDMFPTGRIAMEWFRQDALELWPCGVGKVNDTDDTVTEYEHYGFYLEGKG